MAKMQSPGPPEGKLFGMENFGNSCYCNSILQCLYYTEPFRRGLLQHNPDHHERRLAVPGALPHAFTQKYEQLVAKKLKEQKAPVDAAGRPSLRNSLFGKFSSSNAAAPQDSPYKRAGQLQEALTCELLSTEQRLIVRRNPELHLLPVLETRPESGPRSHVIVGIPNPELFLQTPINPFCAAPNADQRKRLALINGPIINLDHALPSTQERAPGLVLLYALKDIFEAMAENKLQTGIVSPQYFISKLKERNFLFRQLNMHQDAHEFCNYIVNETIESLSAEKCQNWCSDIFQGVITNQTRCLSCETVTSKDEHFLDLCVDIPPGDCAFSLLHSLNNFSKLETLAHQNKFYCNTCSLLQEAVKTIRLKSTPQVLVVNLKRFKYDEQLDRLVKLFDPISYPMKLRLLNTTLDDGALFGLYALVVHIGGGPMHGHYVALCKNKAGLWFLFDDETVELVDENYVFRFFGNGAGLASAYILFYEKLEATTQLYAGLDYEAATEPEPIFKPFVFDEKPISRTNSREALETKEKKLWVNGLRKRELRVEILPERKALQGSIKTMSSVASEKEEKTRRRLSIFSFKRRNKSK